ncbi:hypothetical protein AAZX31_12G018000 [Glycine max]|nr:hypothetical protein JHK84_032881 [Glycine max]
MDFHTLSRKQLQTLCKKNKIPANIANVAMADALAALNKVEGLDDFLNPIEGDAGTPSVNHRTAVRTSTQRKTVREEAEGSKVEASTRRVRVAEEVVELENKDANVPPVTPAASRRRATEVSTRRKKEVEMAEEDGDMNGVQGNPKTPAPVAPVSRRRVTGRSVCTTKIETPGAGGTSAYNTRRSVRLLEKDLSKMSLIDTEDIGPAKIDDDVSQESSNVSHQVEYLYDTGKGDSLQMESTVVSEDIQELEVCSLEKHTEYECQSRELDSDVKLVPVTEIDMVVESHGPNEAGSKKVNCLELEAEPNASDEAGSESLPVLEESSDSSEPETVNKECFGVRKDILPLVASEDAFPDVTDQDIAAVTVVAPDDVSVDVTHQEVAAIPMQSECIMDDQVSNEGDHKEDKNNETREEDEPNDSNLNLEGSFGTCDKSDDAGFEVLTVLEESAVVMQDILPSDASQDAPMEIAPQHTATLTVVVADDAFDQDVAGSLPMSPVNDTPENIKEFVECNTDDDQGISKGDDNQDMNDETEDLNLADGNMDDEDCQHPLNVDESDSMTGSEEDSIQEQKSTDIPVQSDQLKGDVHESKMMKENVTSDDLSTKSIGELKRMLMQLTLNNKSKSKTNDVKDVENKRTALQVLPQNQMKASEAQILMAE